MIPIVQATSGTIQQAEQGRCLLAYWASMSTSLSPLLFISSTACRNLS
jgi:hypothetical protein